MSPRCISFNRTFDLQWRIQISSVLRAGFVLRPASCLAFRLRRLLVSGTCSKKRMAGAAECVFGRKQLNPQHDPQQQRPREVEGPYRLDELSLAHGTSPSFTVNEPLLALNPVTGQVSLTSRTLLTHSSKAAKHDGPWQQRKAGAPNSLGRLETMDPHTPSRRL